MTGHVDTGKMWLTALGTNMLDRITADDKKKEVIRSLLSYQTNNDFSSTCQFNHHIHTPFALCNEILGHIDFDSFPRYIRILVLFNMEFVYSLSKYVDLREKVVYYYTTDTHKAAVIRVLFPQVHIIDTLETDMKFDVVVGNPPYQTKANNEFKKTAPIWQKFVSKTLLVVKEGGILSLIHPSGWRNVDGVFENVKKELCSFDMIHLNMNSVESGLKVFNAATRYDWYIVKKQPYNGITTFVDDAGESGTIKIDDLPFIPSSHVNEIFKYISKDNEEKVDVLYSRSAYGTDKPNMSKEQSVDHVYPCIQNVGNNNTPTKIWWSNTNENGHFGIPKVIFGRFGTGIFLDKEGEYGMSQDCTAISDSPENLLHIKQAMQSERFLKLMKAGDVGGLGTIFNRKVISLLRKDFWKDFV